jgi:hypothetical protein
MTDNDQTPGGSADQWRLDNVRHLAGLTLHFGHYTRWSESWDHDHCAACWAKFAESDEPDVLHEGYSTGPDYPKGAEGVSDLLCKRAAGSLIVPSVR